MWLRTPYQGQISPSSLLAPDSIPHQRKGISTQTYTNRNLRRNAQKKFLVQTYMSLPDAPSRLHCDRWRHMLVCKITSRAGLISQVLSMSSNTAITCISTSCWMDKLTVKIHYSSIVLKHTSVFVYVILWYNYDCFNIHFLEQTQWPLRLAEHHIGCATQLLIILQTRVGSCWDYPRCFPTH